jgi:hypothetical protein
VRQIHEHRCRLLRLRIKYVNEELSQVHALL